MQGVFDLMAFCAIFVPDFLLQAVIRSDPALRNQPLVLLDGPQPTFRVVAVSGAARRLGVTPGLTKAAAAEFKGVQIRLRSHELESAAHAALLDAAWSISPRVENTAIDLVAMDVDGLESLIGSCEEIGLQLQSRCLEVGLQVHVAFSENVETARILASARAGPTIVPPGQESQFLKPLSVDLLAPSEELTEVLQNWGIVNCGAFARLPVLSLSECVGQEAVLLHAIANGKGHRALILAEPSHGFEEFLELDDAVEELEPLSFLLGRLLDQLCARVASRALSVRTILLKFELQPAFEEAFDTTKKTVRAKQCAGTFQCSLSLPRPTQDAKLLLKLLRLRLQDKPPKAPIQKLWMLAVTDRSRAVQGGLFLPAAPDPDKLELTLARIASIVGENSVGSAEVLDSHRPDAFRLRKFDVGAADSRKPAAQVTEKPQPESRQAKFGFRYFRPQLSIYVALDQDRPVKVSWKGNTGKVVHASGPWRLSGEWWEENAWQEDTWEVELSFVENNVSASGVYCIVFDVRQKKWFVRGRYD
jgi:protein ImuB